MVSGLGELTASRGRQISWQKQWQYAELGITTEEEGRFYLKVKSVKVLVAQSCLSLCDPVDCSLPVSSVHGILQARILEWVPISFYRGSSQPRDGSSVSCTGRWILYH